jgi:flagellar biosynthesis protein FlhB
MENPPVIAEPQAQAPQTPMSLPARLFNVLATPGEVFDYIKNAKVSAANWLVPALMVMVVSWLGAWVVFSQDSIQQQLREIIDQGVEKQIQQQHLSGEKAEQARAIGSKFGSIGTKVVAYGAPVFIALWIPFWWGLLLWLIGTKALKADFSYMKAVEVTGLSGMVGVLDAILRTLLILIMGNLFASASLALFVKHFDTQNPVHGLLGAINIMSFWALALRSLGLARLSAVGFGRAAIWVFATWALQTGLLCGFGFAMQKIFAK